MPYLTDLIPGWHDGATDPQIFGLTTDSRKVQPGWLFAALPGTKMDGRVFIESALRAGAAAILTDRSVTLPFGIATALVTDDKPRALLAKIAARFYPRQPATIAAVTGTNGKTSTAVFTQQLWQAIGHNAASLGTLGLRSPIRNTDGSLTTPDSIALHAELNALADEGITHLALEASSHGLSQHRLDGVAITAGAFTNLTRDHLDYHADMADYLNAKARLFTDIVIDGGTAVLNADVPEFSKLQIMAQERALRVLSYGRAGKDIRLLNRQPTANGQTLNLEIFGTTHSVELPLVGAFQTMNVLAALGLVLADEQIELQKLLGILPKLQGVSGRLQSVSGHPTGASIYVDYAHTPDALENAIAAIRPHAIGRVICIVGCGGDRDPGKRPIMGRIAATQADLAIVTDDNPRTEDAAKIRAAMLKDAPDAREIGNRRTAIQTAIAELRTGDALLIAGKGHERGQIIGTTIEPFDDVEEAQHAIHLLKGTKHE